MAVLCISGPEVPLAAFFYKTPPRKVVPCASRDQAIVSLQSGKCKYALVPAPCAAPDGLEIRTVRMGWVLLQRQGQMTRSDRRKARRSEGLQSANERRSSIW